MSNIKSGNALRQCIPLSFQGRHRFFINYTGGTGRTAVKFDTGSSGLGTIPYAVILEYKTCGKPTGVITFGIRKAADDSFQLIACSRSY